MRDLPCDSSSPMKHGIGAIKRRLLNLVILLCGVAGFGVVMMSWLGGMRFDRIVSGGMSPTLVRGDLMLSTGGLLLPSEFKRSQIVLFHPPHSPENRYVQRVAAISGDRVEVIDGALAVNGVWLKSPEGLTSSPPEAARPLPGIPMPRYPLTVPDGHLFLMGDNFLNSLDSRYFGPIETKNVTHIPRSIVFPPGRAGGLK